MIRNCIFLICERLVGNNVSAIDKLAHYWLLSNPSQSASDSFALRVAETALSRSVLFASHLKIVFLRPCKEMAIQGTPLPHR